MGLDGMVAGMLRMEPVLAVAEGRIFAQRLVISERELLWPEEQVGAIQPASTVAALVESVARMEVREALAIQAAAALTQEPWVERNRQEELRGAAGPLQAR